MGLDEIAGEGDYGFGLYDLGDLSDLVEARDAPTLREIADLARGIHVLPTDGVTRGRTREGSEKDIGVRQRPAAQILAIDRVQECVALVLEKEAAVVASRGVGEHADP